MRRYLITIFMHGGSRSRYSGSFASDWDAIDFMTTIFFKAQSIRVRRLP